MNNKYKKIILGSALTIVVSMCVASVTPKNALAQLAVPTAVITNISPTEIKNTYSTTMDNLKSFVLDKLATVAAKQILHQMTADIVGWVNSGFNGKPAFLTNPEAFFLDTADQITGNFIAGNGPLKNLCSPWSVDIRLAIAQQQANTRFNGLYGGDRYYCTLGTIINNARNTRFNGTLGVGNVEAFISGDFSQGGWDAFAALTTDARNQPYASYLNADSDYRQAIGYKKANITADIQVGGGFMSWKKCRAATNDETDSATEFDANGIAQVCGTETPGSVIAGTLMPRLNSGGVELELANSINDVVSALVSQMLTQTLRVGLASMSSSGSGVSSRSGGNLASFTSQIYREATAPVTVPMTGTPSGGQSLQALTSIKSTYDSAIGIMTSSKDRFITARNCFFTKQNSGSLSQTQFNYAGTQISTIDNYINTNIEPLLTALNASSSIVASQISQTNGTGNNTLTVPGTNDADALAQNITTQTQSYIANFDTLTSGTVITADMAQADLELAQSRAGMFAVPAQQYQNACDAL